MLPFSSNGFFIVAAMLVAWVFFAKAFLKQWLPLAHTLLIASLVYLFFYYPTPAHIFLFVVYTYIVYALFVYVIRAKNKLPGTLLLLAPMILFKSELDLSLASINISHLVSFAGISYASFRLVGLYLDSEPGKPPVSPLKYVNFLLFTPTLLIGPIDKYRRFEADIQRGYAGVNFTNLMAGFHAIAIGVFYKYICAELINNYWMSQVDTQSTRVLDMGSYMYAYYLFLFFDFAGYSSMAIGVGKMMGIDVPINFDKPFLARNPQDFWRRFHKSLGDWLKDYFFTPIYKYLSKQKSLKDWPLGKQNVSLFLTFLLMGCWNGFTKHYILSGALFGIYSVVYNVYVYHCKKQRRDIVFGTLPDSIVKWISIFIMFNLVAFAIYIFSGNAPFI